jgi:hypothetical protein
MNEARTDAELLRGAGRNLRRVAADAAGHAAELEAGGYRAQLQPERGRLALREVESAAGAVLSALGSDADAAGEMETDVKAERT